MTLEQTLRRTKTLMSGRRFVVIETQTTGLAHDARILSLCLIELWPDLTGRTQTW